MGDAPNLATRLVAVIETHEALAAQLADPSVLEDPAKLRSVAQRHSDLTPLVEASRRYLKLQDELAQAHELADTAEEELASLAKLEIEALTEQLSPIEEEVRLLLVPKDPLDNRPAVVEIRAGAGGN